MIQPLGTNQSFEHILVECADRDRRAVGNGPRPVQFDSQAVFADGGRFGDDLDGEIAGVVGAPAAGPVVGPRVVVLVPLLTKRAVKDLGGLGIPPLNRRSRSERYNQ